MRHLVTAVTVALLLPLAGCGDSEPSFASIPPDEVATVYRIGRPDTDYLAEVEHLAQVFDVNTEPRPPEWNPFDDNDRGWLGRGGAGDSEEGGNSISINADDGAVGWLYNTSVWDEHSPFCDGCPPMDDYTLDQAIAATDEIMSEMHYVPDIQWEPRAGSSGNTWRVSGYPVVDGALVTDLNFSFVFGRGGELYFAAGYLVDIEPYGTIRRIPADDIAANLDPDTYDNTVPLEPTLTGVRRDNDLYLFPAYNVTLNNGTTITAGAYDPATGPQPLPDPTDPTEQ